MIFLGSGVWACGPMVHGGMFRDVICSGDDISVAVIATPNIRNIQNYSIVYFCALSRILLRELK